MTELEIIERSLLELYKELPDRFKHLPALRKFVHVEEVAIYGESEKYIIDFGTYEVELEDLPGDVYASSYEIKRDYSCNFKINSILFIVEFTVRYRYTSEDEATLFSLGKLEYQANTYTALLC